MFLRPFFQFSHCEKRPKSAGGARKTVFRLQKASAEQEKLWENFSGVFFSFPTVGNGKKALVKFSDCRKRFFLTF